MQRIRPSGLLLELVGWRRYDTAGGRHSSPIMPRATARCCSAGKPTGWTTLAPRPCQRSTVDKIKRAAPGRSLPKEFVVDRLLSLGVSGPDVADVQQQLNARPPTNLAPLNVDEIFGPKTQARVREFQQNNGLDVDGIVGPLTRAAMQGGSPQDIPPRSGIDCGNNDPVNPALIFQRQQAVRANFASQAGANLLTSAWSAFRRYPPPSCPRFPSCPR